MPLDRLAAAGDPHLRAVLLFARAQHRPFTAAEAAVALGVHRTVARSRLDRLAQAGFLTIAHERRGGRRGPGAGRPANVYRVAPEFDGVQFPDRRYGELISLLLKKIPARGREQALREAGEEFGRVLAAAAGLKESRSVRTGLERLCDALGSLGFQVSLDSFDSAQTILVTPTCPLRPLVVAQPTTGEIDRGMWAGLVECCVRGVNATGVECDTARCRSKNESCAVRISLQR